MTQMELNQHGNSDPRAELVDPAATVRFLLAGSAHVTFQSRKTGTRFTYRVVLASARPGDDRAPPHFVSVLTGPDDYAYLGCIFDGLRFVRGKKSYIREDAPCVVAFKWVWEKLFDFGYAMTVHKMQGSQFDDLVVLAERPGPVDNESWKRWLYTAITRAASRLTVLR